MTFRKGGETRRTFLAGVAASPLAGRALANGEAILDDASRLNPTPVRKHLTMVPDRTEAMIAALRRELDDARASGRAVCVSSARHSMGGQSLPRDGVAVTLAGEALEIDAARRTYRVDAGMRWIEVVRRLDAHGFVPAVMQSNSDFGVGATFSVNAHGWSVPRGPFGTTVRSMRILLADGSLVECSPTREPDLFHLAMGGYGLVGIVVDLEVEMLPNELLAATFATMPTTDFAKAFVRAVRQPDVRMAYGRLSVADTGFLSMATMATLRPVVPQPSPLPRMERPWVAQALARRVYRAQESGEAFKLLRWGAEAFVVPSIEMPPRTRSSILGEPVAALAGFDASRTDILHEYFVPPDRLADFMAFCAKEIPKADANFMNVTLRYLAEGDRSVLSYAPSERIAAVMSFSQDRTPSGEADMVRLTRRLIDGALAVGGSFYLPYRLHARDEQIAQAYPKIATFITGKRRYDPKLAFRNAMWDRYLAN